MWSGPTFAQKSFALGLAASLTIRGVATRAAAGAALHRGIMKMKSGVKAEI